jgi:hypothetical protein
MNVDIATRLSARSDRSASEGEAHEQDAPFISGDSWAGSYYCSQGTTRLTLRISRGGSRVQAVFSFATSTGPKGAFIMNGEYDESARHLRLEPGDWVQQPAGFTTVGLDGAVSQDGQSYSGTVLGIGCRNFSVARLSGTTAPAASASAIPTAPVLAPADKDYQALDVPGCASGPRSVASCLKECWARLQLAVDCPNSPIDTPECAKWRASLPPRPPFAGATLTRCEDQCPEIDPQTPCRPLAEFVQRYPDDARTPDLVQALAAAKARMAADQKERDRAKAEAERRQAEAKRQEAGCVTKYKAWAKACHPQCMQACTKRFTMQSCGVSCIENCTTIQNCGSGYQGFGPGNSTTTVLP